MILFALVYAYQDFSAFQTPHTSGETKYIIIMCALCC